MISRSGIRILEEQERVINDGARTSFPGIIDAFSKATFKVKIIGGWAVDFHVGYITREHQDLDITVPIEAKEEIISFANENDGFILESIQFDSGCEKMRIHFFSIGLVEVFFFIRDGSIFQIEGLFWTARGSFSQFIKPNIMELVGLAADVVSIDFVCNIVQEASDNRSDKEWSERIHSAKNEEIAVLSKKTYSITNIESHSFDPWNSLD